MRRGDVFFSDGGGEEDGRGEFSEAVGEIREVGCGGERENR